MTTNFTAAITNLPTTENQIYTFTLYLIQGATNAYYANALTINGSAVSIQWPDAVLPVALPIRTEIETFTIIRTGGTWSVIGRYSTFG